MSKNQTSYFATLVSPFEFVAFSNVRIQNFRMSSLISLVVHLFIPVSLVDSFLFAKIVSQVFFYDKCLHYLMFMWLP
jgi:hypothetical protein